MMKSIATKGTLSHPQRRLLEAMQRLNFGKIELEIHHGEPVFQPPPKALQDVKLGGGENGPRAELDRGDFVLKSQVIELLAHLSRLSDGSVVVIHFAHGLPCRLTIERSL